ncbi:hypothetical protein [Streptomyces scabiei]|uniref:hypothetical protein n=1 Tax=Streptomyces scabiei TaxID=1930 RepID=UPI0029AAE6F5|nr:hypothetical protein [Streptomyces scabiei]MDX3521394.1 hypothetical protein [Streptomyces scabiei]
MGATTARIPWSNANPKGTTATWIRDRFDGLWSDENFTAWYPRDGRPELSPAQLATVCVLQYAMNLSDATPPPSRGGRRGKAGSGAADPSGSPFSTSPVEPARTETATEGEPAEESDEGGEVVPETDAPVADSSPAELPTAAHRTGTETPLDLSDRRIPVLTLGVGPALVGLGIGFLGVRMRRRRAARDGPGPP